MCRKCSGIRSRGADNSNWKGGRVVNKLTGYVRRRVPEHPRNKSGYVPEHILVMEEVLGRYLLLGETVHHKNGVRDDNRPQNLELWAKSQPAGQRVVDLVAWAEEILTRYRADVEQLRLFESLPPR